ncbi:hypothetical protein UlMin_015775 [Ulmus minor]
MGELMVEVRTSTAGAEAAAEASAPPPPPPPPTHPRRPRVREVSSRFMSPLVSSSSSNNGDVHHFLPSKSPVHKHHLGSSPTPNVGDNQSKQRSSSVHRRRRQLEMEPLASSDENRQTETENHVHVQSSETPISVEQVHSTLRRQRPVKPLKENMGGRQTHQHPPPKTGHGKGGNGFATPSRPDTPMTSASLDRIVSSRFRLTQQRSTNLTSTAAAKLLQSSVMSLPPQPTNLASQASSQDANSASQDGCSSQNSDEAPSVSSSIQSLPELRLSMSETDMLPTVSGRLRAEKHCNSTSFSFSRSLNSPLPISGNTSFHSTEGSKSYGNSLKAGGLCLPPVPPCASSKMGMDTKKAKKVSGHQEDVHSLKLLYNRHLQWRYANARAEASVQAQQRETERKVCSLDIKIAELFDSVKIKRIELGMLQRRKALLAILEAQVPFLDQWSDLEADYSVSLAESIQALLNASVQLPLGGNVRVDMKQLQEALNSATKVMETIVSQVQYFIPKAEQTEILISELAKIVGGEKALVEECGNLLSKAYTSQVEECSLRSQIIQFHRIKCLKDQQILDV